MPDPCDFCGCEDVDQGQHSLDCPNSDQTADLYYGFIQALCWASGAQPITFNEPDELWCPSANDNIIFSRAAFLRHFATFDDGPVMLMRPISSMRQGLGTPTDSWEIFCTEHPDSMPYDEADDKGFAFAAEWADRG